MEWMVVAKGKEGGRGDEEFGPFLNRANAESIMTNLAASQQYASVKLEAKDGDEQPE